MTLKRLVPGIAEPNWLKSLLYSIGQFYTGTSGARRCVSAVLLLGGTTWRRHIHQERTLETCRFRLFSLLYNLNLHSSLLLQHL
jgi:hypothetical protein